MSAARPVRAGGVYGWAGRFPPAADAQPRLPSTSAEETDLPCGFRRFFLITGVTGLAADASAGGVCLTVDPHIRQRILKRVNRTNDKPSANLLSTIEWMKVARASIRKRGETNRNRFERRLVVAALCVILTVWLICAIIVRVTFSDITDRMTAAVPGSEDWHNHVQSALLPVELSFTFGGLLFLLAMLLIFVVALVSARRMMFSSEFSLKFFKSPQQQAADLAIECADIHFLDRTARRFALAVLPLLAICSLAAYLVCNYASVPDRSFLMGAYWFIPAVVGIPFFVAVRAVCRRTQRLLRRMKMLDAELHRFMSLRLLWFGRYCFVLIAATSIILLSMPVLGAPWTQHTETQLLTSGKALLARARDYAKHVSQEEFEKLSSDLAKQVEEKPLGIEHWMGLWPVGFRAIAGTAICVGAAFLLAGVLLPSVGAERKNAAGYLLWKATVTLGVALTVSVFWGLMPEMTLGGVVIYALSSLVAFGVTFIVTHVVEFGRMTVRCPYCGRSTPRRGSNCPWCGIWFDVSCRTGEAEFVIPARSDTVHHRQCPTLRRHDGSQFRTLTEAVHHRLGTGFNRALACKRCLGVNPKWEPDPVWSEVRKWVRHLGLLAVHNPTD